MVQNISPQRINIQNISADEKNKRLNELRGKYKYFTPIPSNVTYVPLNNIIKPDNTIDDTIIKQIPSGAIIEIIRPNWDLFKLIGTNLNIAHLGFVVWENNIPYFIHASSDKMMVVKVPLLLYLKNAQSNPKIKGINIQTIVYTLYE